MNELIGKYLNGYKIIKIEKDPFILGQINLITDSLETNFLGDKRVVMFRLRNENTFNAKWYPEQVDKTEQELSKYKEANKKAIEYIDTYIKQGHDEITGSRMGDYWYFRGLLEILWEAHND